MGPGAGDQLPLQAQQTSIGPSIGYAPSRLTPRIDHLPLRPSYSQAVSSSQTSFPPLTSVTKQYAQPVRGSPNMRASNKSNARGNRGPQRGGGVIQQGDRGSSRGSPSRNFPVPRGGSRPDGYGGRVGQINPEVSHQEQDMDDLNEMNEHLTERFGRGSAFRHDNGASLKTTRPPMVLNQSIRKYVRASDRQVDLSNWMGYRDIPSSEEIFDSGRQHHHEDVEVSENIVVGPYESKEDYLERHYALLREDAVAPLRNAVSEVQANPHLMEADSQNSVFIYEKVFITGLTFAYSGIAARITFSLRRVGKKINWEQSKRLLAGAIVALTPAGDMFQSVCHVAVIAARPIAGLEQNPPEIDVFFGAADEVEIDPQQEWVMVESRNGFYEGHRHTLQGLQKLAKEEFPLAEHIIDMERDIRPPKYLEGQPQKDLSEFFAGHDHEPLDFLNVDILKAWPNDLPSGLDASQAKALQRILTKRLAIVQGPPGTGKTHVSVIAIRLMLGNMALHDPPIIVAAHTNHALDQLLRHIAHFEPAFIRLGGWTTDMEIIKPRTLYEVKNAVKHSDPVGSLRGPARSRIKQMLKEMTVLLGPLTEGTEPLSAILFFNYGIITDDQLRSLVNGAKDWVRSGAENTILGDIAMWLGDEQVEAKQRTLPEDFGIDIEEADLEFEQLKELEAETKMVDDEDRDTLRGPRIVFAEPFTGHRTIGVTQQTVQKELQKQDLWDIPADHRGPVYRLMQQRVKGAILAKFRAMAQEYAKLCQEYKIGGWEVDYNYLKQARIIGMTTTGLSKYRTLLQALNPKVVIIEEAAETLEAPIAVACFETLEHLVLVGDHQQLRANCNEPELAIKPFYLGVSMFERLVRNKMEFSQLKRQRRMIPEIRRALNPIYKDLEDHPSVRERAAVPGMGGVNSFFFTHKNRESVDSQMSKINVEEADLIVCFFNYLVQNGMKPNEITVLTFYNGQRKLILRKLREHHHLQREGYFKVVTVDSYQGEENAVVLLSLVRSNEKANIGFLEVENRVCVALSRAQRGFYVFGDAPNLCKSSMLWWYVVQTMANDPCRVGFFLHLTCQKHNEKTYMKDSYDFRGLDGGCTRPCREEMPCGHSCALYCHPFSHDLVDCHERCGRSLECGHSCTQLCFDICKSDCQCDAAEKPKNAAQITSLSREKNKPQAEEIPRWSPTKKNQPPSSPNHQAPSPGRRDQPRVPLHHRTSAHFIDFTAAIHDTISPSPPAPPTPAPTHALRNTELEMKAFQDYAAGGHIESDKNLAAIAERENAEARLKRLDDENFAALFSDDNIATGGVLTEKPDNVNLVRTKIDGQGGYRGVWKGTFEVPRRDENTGTPKEGTSLLDLW